MESESGMPAVCSTLEMTFLMCVYIVVLVAQTVKKNLNCNVGDPVLIPGLERSPGEVNGYPLQCSSLENSMDRVA